jgi:hypothetical protein
MFRAQYDYSQVHQSTHNLYKMWLNMAKKLCHAHIKREKIHVYML